MTKNDKGVWSASLSGLRPDAYTYLYMVDGAPTMDQKNAGTKAGPRGNNNRFLMPGYYYFVRFTGRALNDSPCTFARTSVRCASDDDTGAGAVAAARPVS